MLMLAVIQSVMRQDVGMLVRSAFGYLPMAFILAGVAIAATGLLVAITDDISAARRRAASAPSSPTTSCSRSATPTRTRSTRAPGIPLFGVFLGAIILAIGAFVLWLEMIIRDAAIYICVFFLPLTFVAMIWPATSRWARRLVELLVAIILAKFVIVAILSLATAAIANTNARRAATAHTFEQMIAGAALLVLAAWSPFALLRLIPMMEVAAASVGEPALLHVGALPDRPASTAPPRYMRQAMDRNSRPSTSPAYATTAAERRTRTHARPSRPPDRRRAEDRREDAAHAADTAASARPGRASDSAGGNDLPERRASRAHRHSQPPPTRRQPREAPARQAATPPPPPQRSQPPDPPERRPPQDGGTA